MDKIERTKIKLSAHAKLTSLIIATIIAAGTFAAIPSLPISAHADDPAPPQDPCNGVDDNQNFIIDEGFVNQDDNRNGVTDEPFDGCSVDQCDGRDNNRNGRVDEGFVGVDDDRDGKVDERGEACPQVTEGYMTGGGRLVALRVDIKQGIQLHCDVTDMPNNLEVNSGGISFHLETLTSADCFNDPTKNEGNPGAGFDSYVGTGTGVCNGQDSGTADWYMTDESEPGTMDQIDIIIKCTSTGGNTIISGAGTIDGNFQAHPS